MSLENIETIVILMMENRSFDHMLGHLSLPAFRLHEPVDGLTPPLRRDDYSNAYQGEPYYPFAMGDGKLPGDLPHEREFVATQIRKFGESYAMDGFVEAFGRYSKTNDMDHPPPMGYFTPAEVPITNFLARNFMVCDHWFASLPASTQPNRLMFLSGNAWTDHTSGILPPVGSLVLDWLEEKGVRWRVYHAGLSFFALLGRFADVLGPNFKSFSHLASDVADESAGTFPQVIFVEPSYADAPHIGSDHPNDNHPPLAVGFGEQFIRSVYEALTINAERWAKTLFLVVYDEHGGFFDHVPPPKIGYNPSPDANYPSFESLGVRVPALIASPFVRPDGVFSGLLDHTSILQLLMERFGLDPGKAAATIAARKNHPVHQVQSVSAALDRLDSPRTAIPSPPDVEIPISTVIAAPKPAQTPMQKAFEVAARQMMQHHPDETRSRYPELWHVL